MSETIRRFRAFDRVLKTTIAPPRGSDIVKQHFTLMREADGSLTRFQAIRSEGASLDAKASALLAHVSMMIATDGILLPLIASSLVERAILVGEMVAYIFIAILCVRCLVPIDSLGVHRRPDVAMSYMERQVFYHGQLFRFANTVGFYMTILFCVTIPVLAFYTPQ